MDLLTRYGDSDSDSDSGIGDGSSTPSTSPPASAPLPAVNTAPDVAARAASLPPSVRPSPLPSGALAVVGQGGSPTPDQQLVLRGTDRLLHNPKYHDLYAPVAGPHNPNKDATSQQWASCGRSAVGGRLSGSTVTGYVERYHVNDRLFDEVHRLGSGQPAMSSHERRQLKRSRKRRMNGQSGQEDEYVLEDDEDVIRAFGAEAFVYDEHAESDADLAARRQELETLLQEQERQEQERKRSRMERDALPAVTSVLHLSRDTDYQGRTFMSPPSHLKPVHYKDVRSKLPSTCVHLWTDHSKGVNSIEFFPRYGHLLLSASNDGTVKLWDVLDHRRCIRTYTAHRSAVKKAHFDPDGRRFCTCSFDNTVKVWDTETGKVLASIHNGKTANCVAFCPDPAKSNEIIAGYANRKIIQWDIRSNDIVQEYDRHMGAVNTVTFFNDGKQFVSSSDDKTLRVWDYGIAVEVKYVADPSMHSMPAMALSPSGRWLLGQSLDNQVLVYETVPRFRQHKRKYFKGHLNNSFACQVGFSNDGRTVVSGDSNGLVWFWSWNSCRKAATLEAHDGVCIGAQWHPVLPSVLATCGLDGVIKLWK